MRHNNCHSSIEDMDQLLDHISSFEQDLKNAKGSPDPSLYQEYNLLKEYLTYRIRDIQQATVSELHKITHPNV